MLSAVVMPTLRKGTKRLLATGILLAGMAVSSCTATATATYVPPTPSPGATYAVKPEESPIPTEEPSATPSATETATPEPPSPRPTEAPRTPTPVTRELTPADFSFPVAFDGGSYDLGHPFGYTPCYHWDRSYEIISDPEWWWTFHAGDMHILNNSPNAQYVIVISPIDGKIVNENYVPEGGWFYTIESNSVWEGKRVYCDIGHTDGLFPGDEHFPRVTVGSVVRKGQPLAIHQTVYNWGAGPEQALDIMLRNGPIGANPTLSPYRPDSYIDPFPYLQDDMAILIAQGLIYHDSTREHCRLSGHTF